MTPRCAQGLSDGCRHTADAALKCLTVDEGPAPAPRPSKAADHVMISYQWDFQVSGSIEDLEFQIFVDPA